MRLRDEEFKYFVAYTTNKMEIIERIEELEEKVFKNNRVHITLNQKILLLKHSGILDHIRELFNNTKVGNLQT